jgi:hypothetical protein
MDSKDGIGFAMAISSGIIFGALIDNMFLGLGLGFLVGFGVINWKRSKL